MRSRTAILLTATVDPGAYAHQSGRASSHDRSKDYVSALRFYLSLTSEQIAGVVLCENSNHDFGDVNEFRNLQSPHMALEIITFTGNDKTDNVHYGYSEFGIIDHAIAESKILSECDYFLKISGRLILTNILELLSLIPAHTDLAVDFRRAYRREGGPRYRARTQVMYFNRQFYKDFLFEKRDGMIGVCTHIEEFVPIVVSNLANRANIMLRFPIECEIAGVSGSDNRSYNLPSSRLKRAIRGVVRKNLPQLWL